MSEGFQRRVVSEKEVPPAIRKKIKAIQKEHEELKATLDMASDVLFIFDVKKKAKTGDVDSQILYADICMYGLYGVAASYETAVEF